MFVLLRSYLWTGYPSRYCDWLRAGRSGDRIPVLARFSVPVQTGSGAHPASCTMGTGSFPGVKSGRGVKPTSHPILVPWSWKGRAIPLLPLWALRSVQGLNACTRVYFTFFCFIINCDVPHVYCRLECISYFIRNNYLTLSCHQTQLYST